MTTSADLYYRSVLEQSRRFREQLTASEDDATERERLVQEVIWWLQGVSANGDQLTARHDRERFTAVLDLWRTLLDAHVPYLVQVPPLISAGSLVGETAAEFANEVREARESGTGLVSNRLLVAPVGGPRLQLKEFGVDLTYLHLPNCRFERVDFFDVPLSEGTVFSYCTFVDCSFAGVSLVSTVFSESILKDVDFANADLSYVDFSRSTLTTPRFLGTQLRHAKFSSVVFNRAEFAGNGDDSISMRGVQFVNARIAQLVCRSVDMRESVFSSTQFLSDRSTPSPPRFERCDLRNSHFIDTNLQKASFRGSKVDNVEFPRSKLEGADFSEVELRPDALSVSLKAQLRWLRDKPMIMDNEPPAAG